MDNSADVTPELDSPVENYVIPTPLLEVADAIEGIGALSIQEDATTTPITTTTEEAKPTRDPIHVSPENYPWMYMSSTLDACFKDPEASGEKDLEPSGTKQAENSEASDKEPAVDFSKAEPLDRFAQDAPKIMQAYLTHGEACSSVEYDALKLANKEFDLNSLDENENPMDTFDVMLERLDALQLETQFLQNAIATLIAFDPYASFEGSSESTVARTTIVPLFGSCLTALKSRAENLSLAELLVEGARERFVMDVHLANLEFDEDDYSGSEDESEKGDGTDLDPPKAQPAS